MSRFIKGLPVAFVAATALLLPACEGGGHFNVLGYTSVPQYNTDIHTVFVPIFKNQTFRRGVEFDLTQAVVREIEAKTPYKVVSCRERADTELCGTIVSLTKNMLNRNQNNEVREAETVLAANIVWRDTRTGEVLSSPSGPNSQPVVTPSLPAPGLTPGDGAQPVPIPTPGAQPPAPPPPPGPPPTLVTSIGGFIPELGQSLTSAEKVNVDKLAVQIVSMMERPW